MIPLGRILMIRVNAGDALSTGNSEEDATPGETLPERTKLDSKSNAQVWSWFPGSIFKK